MINTKSSVIEGPFEFDAKTIISGLRIASAYDYPSLRTFCLRKLLDNGTLTPIQQLQVSREFGLEAWEKSAFRELCERKDPITQQEAKIMGIDTFVQVASAREKLQREKPNIGFSAGTKQQGYTCTHTRARHKDSACSCYWITFWTFYVILVLWYLFFSS